MTAPTREDYALALAGRYLMQREARHATALPTRPRNRRRGFARRRVRRVRWWLANPLTRTEDRL